MFFKKQKHYLVVCEKNRFNSRYTAMWLKKFCKIYGVKADVKYAGIFNKKKEFRPEMLNWADLVFVMHSSIKNRVVEDYSANPGKIMNLNLPNIFFPEAYVKKSYQGLEPEKARKLIGQLFIDNGYKVRVSSNLLSKLLKHELADIILSS